VLGILLSDAIDEGSDWGAGVHAAALMRALSTRYWSRTLCISSRVSNQVRRPSTRKCSSRRVRCGQAADKPWAASPRLVHRPRQNLGGVGKRHPEQMLNLGGRREMPPAGWEIADARHVGESDDAAIVETDTLLACSLEWGACHRRQYVAGRRRRGRQQPRA